MNKAAQKLGHLGGKKTSEAKKRAAQRNWKKALATLKRKAANARLEPQPRKTGSGSERKNG